MAIFYNDRGVWDPTKIYLGAWLDDKQTVERPEGGDSVWYQGARWLSNYYHADVNPMQDTPDGGPDGNGAWVLDKSGPAVVYKGVAPLAPTGLTAGFVSDDVVTLFWNRAEVKGIGDVKSYNVYVDGVKVGASTTTSFAVKGLDASTIQTFTVDAVNSTGTSATKASLSVETESMQTENGRYYSPYVDMTLPTTNIVELAHLSDLQDMTLAFMQTANANLDTNGNLKKGEIPTLAWGGIENTTLPTGVMIDQVEQLRALGGTITISFGGYNGRDPAVTCAQYSVHLQQGGMSKTEADAKAAAHLQRMYQSVMDTYGVNHLDFDVENAVFMGDESKKYATVDDADANHLRNVALRGLKIANPDLHISFTAATMPNGVSTDPSTKVGGVLSGSGDVEALLYLAKADGVDVDVVNIMAMDYFDGPANPDMGDNAISAARALHSLLETIGLDAKVGITPMLGQNDSYTTATGNEVFTLDDALDLEEFFASTPWVAGLGAWQLPRDRLNTVDTSSGPTGSPPESDNTGVIQDDFEFSSILSKIALWRPTGGRGDDEIAGTDNADTLSGLGGTDTLLGKGGSDTLNGGADDDLLDGGAGVDVSTGGTGNDTHIVDDAADGVVEAAGGGTADRLMARVSYTLAAGVDVERMMTVSSTATTAINLTGNALTQEITGNYGANILRDGPSGGAADVLKGLNGNDTYQIYNSATTVAEGSSGGTADRIMAGVDYALGAGVYVEQMTTNGASGTAGIDLTGNTLKQEITGNAGANILSSGGTGAADTMTGLGGDDTYRVYNSGDVIVEGSSQGTADKVISSVDYAIASGVFIETVQTNGSTGTSAIDFVGNEIAQTIIGSAGSNILDGKGGNDSLQGLGGKDFFVFSSALGATNVDIIKDFSVADDTIRLENEVFAALTKTGTLAAAAFRANSTGQAEDADDRIIYETDTGKIFYDVDGTGVMAGVHFATVTAALTITSADFAVI